MAFQKCRDENSYYVLNLIICKYSLFLPVFSSLPFWVSHLNSKVLCFSRWSFFVCIPNSHSESTKLQESIPGCPIVCIIIDILKREEAAREIVLEEYVQSVGSIFKEGMDLLTELDLGCPYSQKD